MIMRLLTHPLNSAFVGAIAFLCASGCNKSGPTDNTGSSSAPADRSSAAPAASSSPASADRAKPAAAIQVKGSDTMVNLAQAWAEEYKNVAPAVNVEVSGGGSGVGIAALIKGTIDIANASRNMKPARDRTSQEEHRQRAQGDHRRL